ncbi:MAG: hypothetical protein JWO44_1436 [Bacteroidetes bacterium]|nr:hypothetical protein [Bacteroidota bacterium]
MKWVVDFILSHEWSVPSIAPTFVPTKVFLIPAVLAASVFAPTKILVMFSAEPRHIVITLHFQHE